MAWVLDGFSGVYSGKNVLLKHVVLLIFVAANIMLNPETWFNLGIILVVALLMCLFSVTYLHNVLHFDAKSLPDLKEIKVKSLYEVAIFSLLWLIYFFIITLVLLVLLFVPVQILVYGMGKAGAFISGVILFLVMVPVLNLMKFVFIKYADTYSLTSVLNPFFLFNVKNGFVTYLKKIFKYVGVSYLIFMIWLCISIPITMIVPAQTQTIYLKILSVPLAYLFYLLWDFVFPRELKELYFEYFKDIKLEVKDIQNDNLSQE